MGTQEHSLEYTPFWTFNLGWVHGGAYASFNLCAGWSVDINSTLSTGYNVWYTPYVKGFSNVNAN